MSYEIIYDKQFIKTSENKLFIPMILAGSSNCYQSTSNGRERRARSWFAWKPSKKLLYTKDELLGYAKGVRDSVLDRGESYYSAGEKPTESEVNKHFGYYTSIAVNGHWGNTTYGAFKSIFNAGCDKALTISELNNEGVSVIVCNGYYSEREQERLNIKPFSKIVKNDEELFLAIEECNERFKDTMISTTVEFLGMFDDKPKWIRKRRFKKESREKELVSLDKYYTVLVDGRYLAKHTRSGYKYGYSPYLKFAKEAEANAKVKEFTKKYGRGYSVELVNEKTQIYV